jgi:hypothetical protein
MPAQGPDDRVIAVIDVRDLGPAELTGSRFRQLQARQAPGGDWQKVDFGRAVIIDDAAELAEHHDVYTQILDSGVDVSVLCVAIGQDSQGDPAVALRRPYQLRSPSAATLWIGDCDGIAWRMESSQAELVYPHRPDPGAPYRGLPREFTESLRLRPVFDRVLQAVGDMPGAVASPGICVSRSDVDPAAIGQARRTAVKRLAGTSLPAGNHVPAMEPDSLLGHHASSPATGDPVRVGGPLDQLYQKCFRAASETAAAADHLSGPGGLFSGDAGRVRVALRRLATAMPEFVEAVDGAFEWADPRGGFEAMHYDELDRLGIELEPPRTQEPSVAVDVLSELTLTSLDRGQPLEVISELLRDLADRVVPQGTEPYLARLRRLCPDAVMRRLANPPGVLTSALPGWLSAATVLAALLAGLWPVPFAFSGGICVLGVAVAAAMVRSRAVAVARVADSTGWLFAGAQSAVALIGAVCGIALSRIIPSPVPAWPLGAAIGAGLALVLVVILASVWWSVLIRRWLQALGLPGAPRTARALRNLVAEAARKEWQLAAERRAASDYARIMAGMVDDVATDLRSHAADLLNGHGPGSGAAAADAESRMLDPGRHAEILALVLIDLADAAAGVLGRLFTLLGAGGFATVDAATVQRALETQLTIYDGHLAKIGIYEPPPFGRGSKQRRRLVDSLLERSAGLEQLIWSDVRDDRIVQLCAPEHLALLELEPSATELIKFAPRSAQEVASRALDRPALGAAAAGRIEWVATSRISGLLRLVPLRTNSVEEVWPAGRSDSSA